MVENQPIVCTHFGFCNSTELSVTEKKSWNEIPITFEEIKTNLIVSLEIQDLVEKRKKKVLILPKNVKVVFFANKFWYSHIWNIEKSFLFIKFVTLQQ